MVQMESSLHVADNTGARIAKMIGVLGTRSRSAGVGDVITAHVREATPTANVKKGEVVRAVVVRTAARSVPGTSRPADASGRDVQGLALCDAGEDDVARLAGAVEAPGGEDWTLAKSFALRKKEKET